MTEPVPRVVAGDVVGQVDATVIPRYAGEATFARLPRAAEVSRLDAAVLGVPFDSGVSYRPGARFGPSHIRESSRLLRPYNPALAASPFADLQVADAGDLAVNPFSIDEAITAIEHGARDLLERSPFVLTLGGDHTIALPMLRAQAARHGPVAVVHFDAHLDTWDTYFGAAYTHGTPFRRAAEEGLLDQSGCLHLGIRGPLYSAADLTQDTELGFQIVSAPEVEHLGVAGMVERIRDRVGDRPVYVSVDIDVLDPAHAPGTGTPEAGGLSSRELLATLRSFARLNLVGADVVEVAPAYDHAQITGIAAAHVAYELLTARAVAAARARGHQTFRAPNPACTNRRMITTDLPQNSAENRSRSWWMTFRPGRNRGKGGRRFADSASGAGRRRRPVSGRGRRPGRRRRWCRSARGRAGGRRSWRCPRRGRRRRPAARSGSRRWTRRAARPGRR